MQGRSDPQRELLDVDAVAGHLLPAGSIYAFLAGHRTRLFPEQMFGDLFGSGLGRPSVPADVVAAAIVLQTLNGLSDRETAEAVMFDLRWKAALGLAVTSGAFHPTTLTVWRKRLAASQRPERIFEVVRQVIIETGAVRGKTRRALDSTILDDAVARQDTITQLIAAIRRTARDVPGADALVVGVCTGYDYTRAGKPDIAWDDRQAREELVSVLVTDALALLAALAALPEAVRAGWDEKAQQAQALLALVSGQDVEPAEGSDGTDGRWRIAHKVAPDRVISTVDPEARHAHKTQHRRQDGFRAHIVIEPDTGLITGTELTKVNGPDNSDATVGTRLLAADTTIHQPDQPDQPEQLSDRRVGGGEIEVLGDTAYGTGEALADLDKRGYTPLVRPMPLRPAVEGGFTLDDFTVDEVAGTVTCPNGLTRTISRTRTVTFGKPCTGCPLRAQCTTAKNGRKMHIHPHHALQRAHRERAKDPTWQAVYRRHRPMVERSIAWLTRGNRRVPYRGITKNNTWIHHRVAALNLRRMLTLGLTHHDGSWALTTP
jgi:IS5 family transposase